MGMMVYLQRNMPHFRQVIIVDVRYEVFTRAWCVAELVVAHEHYLPQVLLLYSLDGVEEQAELLEHLDVRDCQSTRPEDKDRIISKIADIELFNDELKSLIFDADTGLL